MITALLLIAGVHVTLPVEAHVAGVEIRLGDVARVSGPDAAEVARVREVSLGYAPAPGHSRLLNALRISEEVRARAPGVDLIFDGVGACRVWPQVEALPGARIEETARAALRLAFAGRDVTLTAIQPAADLTLPKGARPAELRAELSGEARPGRVGVTVAVSVDGAAWRTVISTGEVQEWQVRPVLLRDALPGETIQAAMLEHRRVSVARAEALHAGHLIGARLARPMAAGAALYSEDVVRELLVQVGASLLLEVRRGAVTARVPAVAEENGALGDEVRVRPTNGTRTLRAKVVARDTARVDMGDAR
ncbi:MAG TPA: flagellar basal body P-ring formation chaperone FlgA [Planctomycetota bacterium]|nr:flagellar basal body P-ring formation chaperone FlgA [Planctomycetota bacterium]